MKPSTCHLAVVAIVVILVSCTAENGPPEASGAEAILSSTPTMALAVAKEQGVRNARMPIEG